MRIERRQCVVAMILAAAAMSASAAGQVEASFVEPARYTDAGNSLDGARLNEDILARYLRVLGERDLANGEVLKIEVLDIDLAGTLRPSRRGLGNLRVANGGADFPRMKMRYSLLNAGKMIESGEETVTDLDYLRRRGADHGISDPLRHEKRMLSDWFRSRFGSRHAAG